MRKRESTGMLLYHEGKKAEAFVYLRHEEKVDASILVDCYLAYIDQADASCRYAVMLCLASHLAYTTTLIQTSDYRKTEWKSNIEEDPINPVSWEERTIDYHRIFQAIKEAAAQGDIPCLRFLSSLPDGYEETIEDSWYRYNPR